MKKRTYATISVATVAFALTGCAQTLFQRQETSEYGGRNLTPAPVSVAPFDYRAGASAAALSANGAYQAPSPSRRPGSEPSVYVKESAAAYAPSLWSTAEARPIEATPVSTNAYANAYQTSTRSVGSPRSAASFASSAAEPSIAPSPSRRPGAEPPTYVRESAAAYSPSLWSDADVEPLDSRSAEVVSSSPGFFDQLEAAVTDLTSSDPEPVQSYDSPQYASAEPFDNNSLQPIRSVAVGGQNLGGQNYGAVAPSFGGGELGELPPNPQPGSCYSRLTIPAKYRNVTERVLASPATERVETIPATYRTVSERVVVQPERTRQVAVPATYRTVTENVVVEAQRERVVAIPARYETRQERVKISDAYTTWKKGVNPIAFDGGPNGQLLETSQNQTGEIMCLVHVPAKYETRTVRQLVTPETSRVEVIPAKTRQVTRRVIDQPASSRSVIVPAQYETVQRRVVATPAQTRRIPVPARYQNVTRKVLVEQERRMWAEVLCETNATPQTIQSLQSALQRRGQYTGSIDGVYGPLTARAVQRFQGSGGMVTMDALRELGVQI
ncbi:MAG: peptidoglycan-binding protein [Rhodobacteraceae bacterium]|nr:peptidoglycan-binding protein [Paracoccaceae bacterium]